MNQLLRRLQAIFRPEPKCSLANLYRDALAQLMDDLSDAGDDCHPETGKEYSACCYARQVLAIIPRAANTPCSHDTALITRVNALEDALLAAIPYVRYCYNQAPFGEDSREQETLNLCRIAIGLKPIADPDQEEEQP